MTDFNGEALGSRGCAVSKDGFELEAAQRTVREQDAGDAISALP
jgi:hypothetical protein